MYDLDHVIDVLVRLRLLLREALVALGPRDDPLGGQLLVDASPSGFLDGGGTAHRPASAVTGRAERLLHASRLASQHPTRPAHIPRNDDRLADLAILRRHFRMPGRKRPRSALAVHPHLLLHAVNRVFLKLGDVMANII